MATLEEIKEKIATLIKDSDQKLEPDDIENCIAQAAEHFNKEIPRKAVQKVTPTDSSAIFQLPDDWDEDFSELRAIEFPTDQAPRTFLLAHDDYEIAENEMSVLESGDVDNKLDNWNLSGIVFGFNTDASRKLYVTLTDSAGTRKVEIFSDSAKADENKVAEGTKIGDGTLTLIEKRNSGLSGTVDVAYSNGEEVVLTAYDRVLQFQSAPGANNAFRILYTKRVKGVSSFELAKIPGRLVEPFVQLCAHYCAKALAFYYANTSTPSLEGDIVDYRTKSEEYRELADTTLANWEKVALEAGRRELAYGEKDLDIDFAWGEEKLFHLRRHR